MTPDNKWRFVVPEAPAFQNAGIKSSPPDCPLISSQKPYYDSGDGIKAGEDPFGTTAISSPPEEPKSQPVQRRLF